MVVPVPIGLPVGGWYLRSRGLQLSMAWTGLHTTRALLCELLVCENVDILNLYSIFARHTTDKRLES